MSLIQAGMHPEDIKAAIRKRGKSLSSFSVSRGFHESTARKALAQPVPAIEPHIAEFIGVDLHCIWPDRYDERNLRIRPISKRKSRRSKSVSHCKK